MGLADYGALAAVFSHPGPGFVADLERAVVGCADAYPEAAAALREFAQLLPREDPHALQELYTRTFDVQAITSLDIGYTLFGEDYKRGALLANLSREHTDAANDCGDELADHLANVLRLLPRLADAALREELVRVLLAPAVRAMLREFETESLEKKFALYQKHHKTIIETAAGERRTAYRHALGALLLVLERDFALPAEPPAPVSRFAAGVGTEMGIESGGPCAAK
ncbi:MAG: hypothetical protein IT294_17415 [Deltaproteobacteria bacterium]|nr:hypothetical protein [Deltaproteobacteria bacterium]